MSDLRQNPNYAAYLKNLGWKVEKIGRNFVYVRKILLSSIIKIQRPGTVFSARQLNYIIRKYHPFVIYIEPLTDSQSSYFTKNLGFKYSKTTLIPSKTIRINLKLSDQKLLALMHYKTRYNIKYSSKINNQKSKLEITSSNDIEEFARFWNLCAMKRGMFISLRKEIINIFKTFGKDAFLLNAKYQGRLVGSIMLLISNDTSYYMYAAASGEGKRVFAPTILVWEALKLSKKMNCRLFDFEGIFDDRFPIKSWKGFTRFKKSFGGVEATFPSPLRRYFWPL